MGHLDICQPLMKEFNLVENLKQPCLTGGLTDFSSLCWRVAVFSMCCSTRGQRTTSSWSQQSQDTSADTRHSRFLTASTTSRNVAGKNVMEC